MHNFERCFEGKGGLHMIFVVCARLAIISHVKSCILGLSTPHGGGDLMHLIRTMELLECTCCIVWD